VLGLLLTALLTRHPVRGFTFFRTALFLPQMLAGVVVAQAWVWIYASNGPLNELLRAVGLGALARPWLGDFSWALPAIGGIGTWVTYGLCMVLFIAGAQNIPTSLYDAARVDGAGPLREFFAVTLPGLKNEIVVAFVLTTINALRSFDLIYNTNQGGPGTSTYVPSLYMYQNAFVYNRVGYAAAIAVILAATIFALAFLVIYLTGRGEER
jgi:raffinose/stachyose/melibiose transport system permease protein